MNNKAIKGFLGVFLVIMIACSGCVEINSSQQSASTLLGGMEIIERTYLWGDDGFLTKKYDVRIWALGQDVINLKGISNSQMQSAINQYGTATQQTQKPASVPPTQSPFIPATPVPTKTPTQPTPVPATPVPTQSSTQSTPLPATPVPTQPVSSTQVTTDSNYKITYSSPLQGANYPYNTKYNAWFPLGKLVTITGDDMVVFSTQDEMMIAIDGRTKKVNVGENTLISEKRAIVRTNGQTIVDTNIQTFLSYRGLSDPQTANFYMFIRTGQPVKQDIVDLLLSDNFQRVLA